MGHQQKGKSRKRKKSWHRGQVESDKWTRTQAALPYTEQEFDPTLSEITPQPHGGGRQHPKRHR